MILVNSSTPIILYLVRGCSDLFAFNFIDIIISILRGYLMQSRYNYYISNMLSYNSELASFVLHS